MRATLTGRGSTLDNEQFLLSAAETVIGRSRTCDICVPHSSISRWHCVIRQSGGELEIEDIGSHNGTFVNGLPVRQQQLEDGDRISIGMVTFVLRMQRDEEESQIGSGASDSSSSSAEMVTVYNANVPLARETTTLLKVGAIARTVQTLYLGRNTAERAEAERSLFKDVLNLVPARRGAVLICEGDRTQPLGCADLPEQSKSVMNAAMGVVPAVDAARAPVSGVDDGLAWLAAPLLASGRMLGLLYVDAAGIRRDFVEADALMMSALGEIMALALENARDLELLRLENSELLAGSALDHNLVGQSPPMQRLFEAIARVAPTDSTVLIQGESGTGKELIARAIHRNSRRSGKPFIAINCAAIAETLIETEFFGHEKGAFTGAYAQRKGKLEAADGGTVFLDEIGELAPILQAKLLRALQEREFERVGGTRPVRVDIRVIAATNQDLGAAVREGRFRQDLFYRLNVVSLEAPPLRERRDDIPLLAASFAERMSQQTGRKFNGISREARAALMAYNWPGNVRELQNVIERAMVLGTAESIVPEDLPETILDAAPSRPKESGGFHDAVREARKQLILDALEQARGNVTEAAKILRLHPNYLHRLMTSLDLRGRGA